MNVLVYRSGRLKQLVKDFLYNGIVANMNQIVISYTEGEEVKKSERKAAV